MTNEQMKHLEFIQNIITRMNSNSFQIKGLTITIVSALLAVYASTKNKDFILISLFPVLIFWFLDAYYLGQERKFRGLYNDLIGESKHQLKPFQMRPDLFKGGQFSFWSVFISKTIVALYLSVIILLVVTYFYLSGLDLPTTP